MWTKVDNPELRPKGVPDSHPALDTKLRTFGGLTTPDIGIVRVDLGAKLFWCWFQDIGWKSFSFAPLSLTDYDVFLHVQAGRPRLKIAISQWAQGAENESKQANSWILDSGYEYQ